MSVSRMCSRAGCPHPASATLTYVYSDSTVVLGPLATYAEPHAYDLCAEHAGRLTAPRGWEVVRLDGERRDALLVGDLDGRRPAGGDGDDPDRVSTPPESHDDLVALAEVVRRRPAPDGPAAQRPATGRAAEERPVAAVSRSAEAASSTRETGRRGHLRVLRDDS